MRKSERDERYTRGRDFETRIAKLFRQKGFPAARDGRSGAGWFKGDIHVPGQQFHIEAKSQEKIRLMEFWEQACANAGYKTPVLMLDQGGYDDLAIVRLSDFLDLVKVIADDSATIKALRS